MTSIASEDDLYTVRQQWHHDLGLCAGPIRSPSLRPRTTSDRERRGERTERRSVEAGSEAGGRPGRGSPSPNPEDMPALGPQKYPHLENFDACTGHARGDALIGASESDHRRAPGKKADCGRICSALRELDRRWRITRPGFSAITATPIRVSPTPCAMPHGTSSGWATQMLHGTQDLNGEESRRASRSDKCARRREEAGCRTGSTR